VQTCKKIMIAMNYCQKLSSYEYDYHYKYQDQYRFLVISFRCPCFYSF